MSWYNTSGLSTPPAREGSYRLVEALQDVVKTPSRKMDSNGVTPTFREGGISVNLARSKLSSFSVQVTSRATDVSTAPENILPGGFRMAGRVTHTIPLPVPTVTACSRAPFAYPHRIG